MKNNIKIISILVLILVTGCYFGYTQYKNEKQTTNDTVLTVSPYSNSKINISIFKNIDSTYGYDIFIDDRQYIHQSTVPGFAGTKGFMTEIDARKTAELVITKIRNNRLPPTVTVEELKNIGIE